MREEAGKLVEVNVKGFKRVGKVVKLDPQWLQYEEQNGKTQV